jgi:hypothetical protein
MIPYSIRWLSAIVVPLWKMQADGSWFLKSYATELGLLIFSIKTDGYRRSADRWMLKSNRFLKPRMTPNSPNCNFVLGLWLANKTINAIKPSMQPYQQPSTLQTESEAMHALPRRSCWRGRCVEREESWKVAKSGRFRTSIASAGSVKRQRHENRKT